MAMNTRSASANLANAKMINLNINRENTEHIVPAGKAGLGQRPHTSQPNSRLALDDIGNKVSGIALDGNKKAPIKKEILQLGNKQKTMVKSKATASLKGLVESTNTIKQEKVSHAVELVEKTAAVTQEKKPFHFIEPAVPSLSSKTQATAVSVPSTTVLPQQCAPAPMDTSDCGPDAFSKVLLNVQDIDAHDKDNPQLVSEYVNDIYEYMRMLELKYPVRANYLEGMEVTGKMRAILIDWLCQVHHRFHLLQETLYLTVAIIDRFLQVRPVSRSKLQLVGVTAMLIASKYEEMFAPEVADFVYITDNAYTKGNILEMEGIIMKALNFSFGKPLCLHFLRRNSKAGQVDANKHTLAKYLMELTIVEYDMVQYNPSEIAAAALALSMKLLDGSKWTDTLSHYSAYTENKLLPTMQKLASLVIKAETSKLTAVRTKYSSSKFNKISTISELKSQELRDLAAPVLNTS